MKKKKMIPSSLRKYIRLEKARIRRNISDPKEQAKQIEELCQKHFKQNEGNGSLQTGD